MEQSYVMLKPGYLEKEKEIIERLLRETGATVKSRGQFRISEQLLLEHYAHVAHLPFFSENQDGKRSLKEYMTSGDVIGFVLEGEDGLVGRIRASIGRTDASDEGSIRYDFIFDKTNSRENVIHASGNVEEAEQEIKRFAQYLLKI